MGCDECADNTDSRAGPARVAAADSRLLQTVNVWQTCAAIAIAPDRTAAERELQTFVGHIPCPGNLAETMLLSAVLLEVYLRLDSMVTPDRCRPMTFGGIDSGLSLRQVCVASPIVTFRRACQTLFDRLPKNDDPLEVKARHEFDRDWRQLVRVGRLAAELEVHPRTLRRRFKNAFGVSIQAYRLHVRARHAVDLLSATDLPLTAIARTVGCCDQAALAKLVKRFTGLRPRQIREESKRALQRRSDRVET
jgi:AraC-like DNA-binding protein